MRISYITLVVIVLELVFAGLFAQPGGGDPGGGCPPGAPTITSFTPTSGPVGTTVTINGAFCPSTTSNIVYFGATLAVVTNATSSQLTVTVPVGATYQPITVITNGLVAYSNAPFVTTYTGWGVIDANTFVSKTDFTTGNVPNSVAIGDFDGDGKADLAVANYSGDNSISVYRNTSAGVGVISYAARVNYATNTNPRCVSSGDLDGDGKLDLAVVNWGTNYVSIFRNTSTAGSISFAPKVDFVTGANPVSVTVGDVDGDQRADIAVANWSPSSVSILRNTGTATGAISFAAKVDYTVPTGSYSVSMGDLDNDGKLEVAVTSHYGNSVSVFRNTSTGAGSVSFATRIDYTTGANPHWVSIGDLDADGKQDLAVANTGSNTVSVLRNTSLGVGSLSFAAKQDYALSGNPNSVSIGDLDGDGRPDLAVACAGSSGSTVAALRNTSAGAGSISYSPCVDYVTRAGTITMTAMATIGDFDGDGKSDLVAANSGVNTLSVFLHQQGAWQTINSFGPFAQKSYGDAPLSLNATATSGLPVSYTSSNSLVATVSGSTVTITGYGTSTITASQAGNGTYGPVSVSQVLAVGPFPTITNFTPASGPVGTSVTINGSGFSASTSGNTVYFGTTKAAVSAATANQLTVTVPVGATYQPITVECNGLTGYSKSSFATTYSSWGTVDAGSFVSKTDFTPGANPMSVVADDLDGDGQTDLIIASYGSSIVSIYRNTSTGVGVTSFASKVDYSTPAGPAFVSVGDIDGDGKNDLAVANNIGSFSIFRNTSTAGSISFAPRVDFATDVNPKSLSIGDLDADGRLDLAVACWSTSSVSIFRNTGTGVGTISFASGIDYVIPTGPVSVSIGDLDGDGKSEVAVTSHYNASVSVFRNTSPGMGSIAFATRIDYTTGANPHSVSLGDLDGDGKQDMAVANSGGNTVSVLRNTSTGLGSIGFAPKVDFATGTTPNSVVIGDLDGDGKRDLAAANYGGNSLSVLRNTSTGSGSVSYAPNVDFAVGVNTTPYAISIGDFDGDGKSDLAAANYGNGTMSVFLHQRGAWQTINSFNTFPQKKYSDPAFFLSATATSGLAVTYSSSLPSVATVSGNTVTITGYGTTIVTASQVGDSFYGPVSVSQILEVGPFPAVTNFTPTSGPVGTTVTINGSGFSSAASANLVYFGATRANVTSATATQLLVTVPIGATYKPVTVEVNGLTGYSNSPFVTTDSGWGAIDASSFVPKTDFATGTTPYSVSVGDFDGDGKSDLAVANNNSVSIYRNTSTVVGAVTYQTKVDYATGTSPTFVSNGDFDGDGKQDLVVTNYSSNTVSILRNTSTGIGSISFAPKVDYPTGSTPSSVAIGDLDQDGKLDFVATNFSASTISIYRNLGGAAGSINFGGRVDLISGVNPYSIAIGDLDNDGKVDLAIANHYGSNYSVFRNISTGMGSVNFASRIDSPAPGSNHSVAISDLDGDGKADLIFGNNNSSTTLSIVRNTSTGIGTIAFAAAVNFTTGSISNSASISDLDGDGKVDIAVANYSSGTVSVFQNTGTAGSIGLAPKVDYATGTNPQSVSIGDFDGDGKSDLAVANSTNSSMTVILHKADQVITFNALSTHVFGDSPFALTATASSGLPVSYGSSNSAVATISGSTVTVVGVGSTIITASQPGNANIRAAGNVSQTLKVETKQDRWSFQYRYDSRRRMTQKKVPGADWVYMVYDDRDRLVLTQDGNQRLNNQWLFTKYDALNRPVSTGFYSSGSSVDLPTMQANVNSYYTNLSSSQAWFETFSTGSGNVHNYDDKSFPQITDPNAYLTITYYDDNTAITTTWGATYNYASDNLTSGTYSQPASDFRSVTGHLVAAKVKLLDGSNTWLKSSTFYDNKYRVIQSVADNAKGGTDRVSSLYDFTGKVLTTKTTHQTSTHAPQTITHSFVYDYASRLLQTWHGVNGATAVLLSQNEYNEIGQLVDRELYSSNNGASFKQSVDYRYNIRGWLTSINNSQLVIDGVTNDDSNNVLNDLFGMELGYNNAIGTLNSPMYNGNISAVKWSSNQALGPGKDVGYNYSYDAMNRITGASYLTNTTAGWSNPTNAFSESGYQYDLNGNIQKLQRLGSTGNLLDSMYYGYVGNQLLNVKDSGDKTAGFVDGTNNSYDYGYDPNGNMVYDQNKSLTATNAIQYNHLNLPTQVTKSTNEKIVYSYDAGGRKLKQQVYNSNGALAKTTDYDGEFIYQGAGVGDTLQFINHDEGRVVMKLAPNAANSAALSEYQYYLKDHLGNVRLTFTTQPGVDQPVATFETANQTTEASEFLRYSDARTVNSVLFDHTHNGVTSYSERLSGSTNEKTGVARSISVMPGDTIKMEVYAKYVDGNNTNNTAALTQLLAQIVAGTASAGTVVDGAGYATNGLTPFPYLGLAGEGNSTGNGPKAFLNYLIFDRNYVLVNGGYVRMSNIAKEDGTNVPHERLAAEITIAQPGYVYVYLSNENDTPIEVYFDDFKVTQTKSPLVQQEDFYPFGLKFNSYTRENSVPNTLKLFQGQEHIDDLSLDWDSFKWRNHQPEIGRFFNVDPLSEKYVYNSPYAFSENRVIDGRELEGLEYFGINTAGALAISSVVDKKVSKQQVQQVQTGEDKGISQSAPGALAIMTATLLTPGVAIPFMVSYLTGVPVTPAPQAIGAEVGGVAAEGIAVEMSAGARAKEIHSAVSKATQSRTTIAVGEAVNSEGQAVKIVGSSENRLRPAQRAMLRANEVEATGAGHAEVTILNFAKNNGMTVNSIGASRPICQACASALDESGVIPTTSLKKAPVVLPIE